MKVGDLVQYRYTGQDIGIIIEDEQEVDEERTPKLKVMWLDTPHLTDWMRPTGLVLINESR
tara:strand:- start:1064 stop:1246 length:183 start_codon:yes stop_codon:yes gene_type:complete